MSEKSDLYSCSICLDDMIPKTPRSLSCLHTFCEPCLDMLLSNFSSSEITCPTCRHVTNVPQGKVTALPKNFLLKKMFSTDEKEKQAEKACQSCRTKGKTVSSILGCIECEIPLCKPCSDQHLVEKGKNAHTMVTMNDYDNKAQCGKHQRTKKFYCIPCKVPICIVCRMEETHQSHFDKVKQIASGVNEIMSEMLEQQQEASDLLNVRVQKMTASMDLVDKMKEKCAERMDYIILKIQDDKEKTLKALYNDYEQPTTEVMWKLIQQGQQLQKTRKTISGLKRYDVFR